jgi:hypothetical protein
MPIKIKLFHSEKNGMVVLTLTFLVALATIFYVLYSSLSVLYREYRLTHKIATMFVDTSSVVVKNTFFSENGSWCGMVDAKNRYGDYTGYRMFATTKSGVFMSDEMTKPACIGFPDGSQLESAQCDDDRIKAFDRTTGFKDVFLNFYSKNCKKRGDTMMGFMSKF